MGLPDFNLDELKREAIRLALEREDRLVGGQKPHLQLSRGQGGSWLCKGQKFVGKGPTPSAAYMSWLLGVSR